MSLIRMQVGKDEQLYYKNGIYRGFSSKVLSNLSEQLILRTPL